MKWCFRGLVFYMIWTVSALGAFGGREKVAAGGNGNGSGYVLIDGELIPKDLTFHGDAETITFPKTYLKKVEIGDLPEVEKELEKAARILQTYAPGLQMIPPNVEVWFVEELSFLDPSDSEEISVSYTYSFKDCTEKAKAEGRYCEKRSVIELRKSIIDQVDNPHFVALTLVHSYFHVLGLDTDNEVEELISSLHFAMELADRQEESGFSVALTEFEYGELEQFKYLLEEKFSAAWAGFVKQDFIAAVNRRGGGICIETRLSSLREVELNCHRNYVALGSSVAFYDTRTIGRQKRQPIVDQKWTKGTYEFYIPVGTKQACLSQLGQVGESGIYACRKAELAKVSECYLDYLRASFAESLGGKYRPKALGMGIGGGLLLAGSIIAILVTPKAIIGAAFGIVIGAVVLNGTFAYADSAPIGVLHPAYLNDVTPAVERFTRGVNRRLKKSARKRNASVKPLSTGSVLAFLREGMDSGEFCQPHPSRIKKKRKGHRGVGRYRRSEIKNWIVGQALRQKDPA